MKLFSAMAKLSGMTKRHRLAIIFGVLAAGAFAFPSVEAAFAETAAEATIQAPQPSKPKTKTTRVSALPPVQVQEPRQGAPGSSEAVASKTPPLGPYYVDFRARTAASYGHAFIWYGKSSERAVDVAGLHPATDDPTPYVLGHLVPVPSETGASYGDLDEQYLTAQYRVYLSAGDAPKVFDYIKHLQATTPFWHATTTNCTWFIGQIASFMGLKTPPNIYLPEEYVNELRKLNDGREFAQLPPKN